MHEYELMYILHPRLTAEETTAAIERVSERIQSGGGEVIDVDNWGKRRLAYPIKHHFEGTYVLTTLRLPPDGTARLESALRISEDVIRHLLIRGIIPYEGPSMQEERGRSQRSTPSDTEEADGEERPVAPAAESSEAAEAEPAPAASAVATAEAEQPASENDGSEPGSEAEGERAAGSAE